MAEFYDYVYEIELFFPEEGVLLNWGGILDQSRQLLLDPNQINLNVTFVEPTKEQRKWNMRENFAWLSIRGLDTNGKAEQLRSREKN